MTPAPQESRRDVTGVIYLLHFDRPIGNTRSKTGYAQHYTGWASDLVTRLAQHMSRSDAKIVQAFRQAGIGWELARTWSGTRARERQIKAQGGAARHCPVCKGQPPQVAATAIEASYRVAVPAPRQAPAPVPPVPEPPLWESIVARLDTAEAAALLAELAAAERAAWTAAGPDAGPECERRLDLACDVSRLRGEEASAAERLAEARAIAEAEQAPDPNPRRSTDVEPIRTTATAPEAAALPDGTPHPDPYLAERGWQAHGGVYVSRGADRGQDVTARLLDMPIGERAAIQHRAAEIEREAGA